MDCIYQVLGYFMIGFCGFIISPPTRPPIISSISNLAKRELVISPEIAYRLNDGGNEGESLNNRSDGDQISGDFGTMIGRRQLLFLTFGLGGFFLSIWAGSNFDDDERKIMYAALFGLGLIWLFGSLGLLWATQFSATWGWWL